MRYKFLEHTADIKFQAFGKSLEEAFSNSALALKEVIAPNIKIKEKIKKNFSVEAPTKDLKKIDYEKMLYSFLEEILFLLDAENFLFAKVKVKINFGRLEAEIIGDKASSYKFTNEVKAVTYNQMFVKKQGNKFIIQVVLDV